MTVTILSVRMTDEEKARLEAEADHAGMKLSAYVRKQLLGADRPKRRFREVQEFHDGDTTHAVVDRQITDRNLAYELMVKRLSLTMPASVARREAHRQLQQET